MHAAATGPYVKWFLDKLKPDGLVRLLDGWTDKSAEAVCTYAYANGANDTEVLLFQGRMTGRLVMPPPQSAAEQEVFGWDACFVPEGYSETYGKLDKKVKNSISHGYLALEKLRAHFMAEDGGDNEV